MRTRTIMSASAAAVLALGLSACGGGSGGDGGGGEEAGGSSSPAMSESPAQSSPMEGAMGDKPFGPACSEVPKEGEGSVAGMADDPVATAASNNPLLSTLTDAVKQAELVDTLNSAEDITVFAPANSAFEKVPEEDLTALLDDKEQLTDVLTYHVVEGKHGPSDLEDGTFTSLQGAEVTTSGSGEEFMVNDEAKILCGNVQTANATVYLIDTVLMPPEG